MTDEGSESHRPPPAPAASAGTVGEAYALLRPAVGAILKGSDEARDAFEALRARGASEEEAREEIAQVLLAVMFHVGAQSDMLKRAGGGSGLRREALARLAAGETARQIFEIGET